MGIPLTLFPPFSPDPPFATFGTILLLMFIGYMISREKPKKKRRKRHPEVKYYERDILGQVIPVYSDKSENYKPVSTFNLRIAFFILVTIIVLLFFTVPKKHGPLGNVSGNGRQENIKVLLTDNIIKDSLINPYRIIWFARHGATFNQTPKISYKIYKDPMFPAEYITIYEQPNYSNIIFKNPIEYVKTPYFNQK